MTEKFSLETKDIGKILSMIEPEKRFRYDYDNIEKLYIEYTSNKVDDTKVVEGLKDQIGGKEVLVMVPGSSLNTERENIDRYIDRNVPFVISVNFVADYRKALAFLGNEKSYARTAKKRDDRDVIVTSNVNDDGIGRTRVLNYSSLIDRKYKYFENSTFMLFRLLRKLKIKKLVIAGFDGFDINKTTNYANSGFQNDRHIDKFGELNDEIRQMMENYKKSIDGSCEIIYLTPSIFG